MVNRAEACRCCLCVCSVQLIRPICLWLKSRQYLQEVEMVSQCKVWRRQGCKVLVLEGKMNVQVHLNSLRQIQTNNQLTSPNTLNLTFNPPPLCRCN